MVDLIAESPAQGHLPVSNAGCELSELPIESVIWISRLGEGKTNIPQPGTVRIKDGARWIWHGADQALVMGTCPQSDDGYVTVDQSDAWGGLHLRGEAAPDVLARLTPVDLRVGSFPVGSVARTVLGHISVSLIRASDTSFDLLVPRSMTLTAIHELTRAMKIFANKQ